MQKRTVRYTCLLHNHTISLSRNCVETCVFFSVVWPSRLARGGISVAMMCELVRHEESLVRLNVDLKTSCGRNPSPEDRKRVIIATFRFEYEYEFLISNQSPPLNPHSSLLLTSIDVTSDHLKYANRIWKVVLVLKSKGPYCQSQESLPSPSVSLYWPQKASGTNGYSEDYLSSVTPRLEILWPNCSYKPFLEKWRMIIERLKTEYFRGRFFGSKDVRRGKKWRVVRLPKFQFCFMIIIRLVKTSCIIAVCASENVTHYLALSWPFDFPSKFEFRKQMFNLALDTVSYSYRRIAATFRAGFFRLSVRTTVSGILITEVLSEVVFRVACYILIHFILLLVIKMNAYIFTYFNHCPPLCQWTIVIGVRAWGAGELQY